MGETDQPLDSVPMETDSHPNDPKYGKLNLRRASMSLEERHTEFKEMLLERGVSELMLQWFVVLWEMCSCVLQCRQRTSNRHAGYSRVQ